MEKIVEKLVEIPVETIVEKTIEVPVEKIVEVPVEVIKEVIKEVPVEVIRTVEVPVEKVIEKVVAPQSVMDQLAPQADNFDPFAQKGSATFGTAWPAHPAKGDLFLKVDNKPNKLYKWNGRKWIEIDRQRVDDTLVYDPAYIDYVIDQVRRGHRDYDDLTDIEKSQVVARIRNQ